MLWLIMLYYHTKFGCKWTISLEDVINNSHILIIKALAVTLTFKIVNQFFLYDTSPHDNTPPCQVW